jgi:hypothetical protein
MRIGAETSAIRTIYFHGSPRSVWSTHSKATRANTSLEQLQPAHSQLIDLQFIDAQPAYGRIADPQLPDSQGTNRDRGHCHGSGGSDNEHYQSSF